MLTSTVKRVSRRLPWSTFRSWAAYAALPVVGIITAPILARALGPEGRGHLAAILQPLSVADAFAAIGVPAAMTFFIARGVHPDRLRRPAILLLGISTAIVATALFAYSFSISRAAALPQHLLLMLWGSTIVGAFIASRRGAWQGLRTYKLLDGERATAATTRLLLIILLFLFGATISFPFALAYIISGLIASSILFFKRPTMASVKHIRPREFSSFAFARYSVLASLGTISMMLNNRLDQAALPAVVSATDLGFYSVAVTVAEVPLIIATVMNRNLLAEVSSKSELRVVIRTGLTGVIGVGICCVGLAVLAPLLVPMAFGASFIPSVPLVQLLLIGTLLGSLASGISVVITGRGRPGLGSLGPGCAAAATTALLLIYWHEMTVEIAAIIAIFAQAIAVIVSALALGKLTFWRKN